MNIFNFLTPKSEVKYLLENETVHEAADKFLSHGYTAVPVISRDGEYLETLTEGDILRYILAEMYDGGTAHMDTDIVISLPVRKDIRAVHVNEDIYNLIELCKTQNFVPVVDDREIFIGIVTRKDLICFVDGKYKQLQEELAEK